MRVFRFEEGIGKEGLFDLRREEGRKDGDNRLIF